MEISIKKWIYVAAFLFVAGILIWQLTKKEDVFAKWEKENTVKVKNEELSQKIDNLFEAGKYDEALVLAKDLSLQSQYDLLDKYQMLQTKLGNFEKVLDASLKMEELSHKISERESPWDCVRLAEAYIGLKDYANSIKWLEKAVYERKFKRLAILEGDVYNIIKSDPRYVKIIETSKEMIGLNSKAKDFTINLLDGTPITLSKQTGKVVLIDFWDTACIPCRRAMPHLKELHDTYKDQGLEIIGISLDTDKSLFDKFLNATKLPWLMSCSFKGWGDETAKLYEVNATPSTWLIDRKGILRHYEISGEELEKAIEILIKES